jgi:DNA-binding MarR family transcriptional regulator
MHDDNAVVAWVIESHDRLTHAARQCGIDLRELAALTLIASHPDRGVEWLRLRVGLTQSGTVRLLDRLEGRQLVSRKPGQGRAIGLHVTRAGAAVLRRWQQERDATVSDLLRGIDGAERTRLSGQLAGALARRPRSREQADQACRACDWPQCAANCPVDVSVRPP